MAPIDRLGSAVRRVGRDDTLIGTITAVLVLMLFAGTLVALRVYDRQADLEQAIVEARQASRTNGEILTFIQGCTIPEDAEHTHPEGWKGRHEHNCFVEDRQRAAGIVVKAAVEIDCRNRRAIAGLAPPPDGLNCDPRT